MSQHNSLCFFSDSRKSSRLAQPLTHDNIVFAYIIELVVVINSGIRENILLKILKQIYDDIRDHLGSPRFLVGSVLLIILVVCILLCFVCLCPVTIVPNVASVCGLSILDCPFIFL